jgi:hypothetical protein
MRLNVSCDRRQKREYFHEKVTLGGQASGSHTSGSTSAEVSPGLISNGLRGDDHGPECGDGET